MTEPAFTPQKFCTAEGRCAIARACLDDCIGREPDMTPMQQIRRLSYRLQGMVQRFNDLESRVHRIEASRARETK